MAIARLPVIFILLAFDLLQIFVQGQILCSCPSGIPKTSLANLIASEPRIGELISKAKSQKLRTSQDCKCGNNEVAIGIQSNKPQQNRIRIQDYPTLKQKQICTVPLNSQPLSVDTRSPLCFQNFEQIQLLNTQQLLEQQSQNIQSPRQSAELTLNSQQLPLSLHQICYFPNDNSRVHGQQRNMLSEIPLASLQAGNQITQDLLSQNLQGIHLSDIGQPSSIPVMGLNSCQNAITNQIPVKVPQNNAATFCNLPSALSDVSQNTNGLSILPAHMLTDYSTSNHQQSNTLFIPWSSPAVRISPKCASKEIKQNPNSNQAIEVQQPIPNKLPIHIQAQTQTQQSQQTQEHHQPQQVIQTQQRNQVQSLIQNQRLNPTKLPTQMQQNIEAQQFIQNENPIDKLQPTMLQISQPPNQMQTQLPTQIEQPMYMQQQVQEQQPIHTPQSSQTQKPILSQEPVQVQQHILIQQPAHEQTPVTNTPSQLTEVQFIPQTTTDTKSSTPTQSSPDQPAVSQQVSVSSSSCQPTVPFDQCQPAVQNQLSSFDLNLLSQLISSGSSPQYPSNSQIYTTKSSSKSGSAMKALLPLIFNLLKEKNNGYGSCPSNCNCGCMNNYGYMHDNQQVNPFNCNNYKNNWNNIWPNQDICTEQDEDEEEYEDEDEEEEDYDDCSNNVQINSPQVSDSYASQIKYGLPKEKDISENCIDSAETGSTKSKVSPKKVQEKQKYAAKDYQIKKKIKSKDNDSDYYESYENEN